MRMDRAPFERKPFILMVDDHPENLRVLAAILDAEGYHFTPATSGEQALKILNKRPPDLILLDIMMPGMNGYEVCRILKDRPATRDIPVIFLTARFETGDIVKGFDLGCADYVTKPFNAVELLARIRTHLSITRISNERRELIHVLCHDLTNIFNPIIACAALMKDAASLPRLRGEVLSSAKSGLKLITLIRKIHAWEEGKLTLDLAPVNLREAVAESAMMMRKKASEKQVTLRVEIDADLHAYAEPVALTNSVINNLLANAIKFSFPGGTVFLTAERDADRVILTVRDDGIGMSQSLLAGLFDITRQTTRPGTAGEEGTGYGMPLVQKFVQACGGDIVVTSREKAPGVTDHGTQARVRLRAAPCPEAGG